MNVHKMETYTDKSFYISFTMHIKLYKVSLQLYKEKCPINNILFCYSKLLMCRV